MVAKSSFCPKRYVSRCATYLCQSSFVDNEFRLDRRGSCFETRFTMPKLVDASKTANSGTQPLTSLAKGLKLLLALRDSSRPVSLTELSRDFGFNKVSALRILLTLEQHRFVEKNVHDKKYQIGSNAFYVGSGFIVGGKRNKIL
jgi:IclR-like helix-turn-helix domain-containing protein